METKLTIAKVKGSLLMRRAEKRQLKRARELAGQAKGLSGSKNKMES